MNDSFDEELRRELARVEPPDGFADRVMANLPETHGRRRYWLAAVAAGLAVLFTAGGLEQSRREHQVQAERTQRQVVFALSLAAEKLDHVNARLQRSAPDLTIEGEERGRL
jgi:hypothetical protein